LRCYNVAVEAADASAAAFIEALPALSRWAAAQSSASATQSSDADGARFLKVGRCRLKPVFASTE